MTRMLTGLFIIAISALVGYYIDEYTNLYFERSVYFLYGFFTCLISMIIMFYEKE